MTGRHDDERTDVAIPPPATNSESATQPTYPTPEQASVVQDGPGTPGVELEGGSMLDEQGNYKPDNLVDDQD